MAVGLGFVSICLSEENCSPAGNVTVKSLQGLDRDAVLGRIRRTARRNLANTRRILWFLKAHRLQVYRFATHLIPLATHEATAGWEWWQDPELGPMLADIGRIIRSEGFRVSTHPPQLCVLNTPDPNVFQWVEKYAAYHCTLFDAMGLGPEAKIILHVGRRLAGGTEAGLRQALANVNRLPGAVRTRLALENDDRVFSARETLAVCREAGLPMVFDLHHHLCRHDGEDYRDLLPSVFDTWLDRPPKVHLSSPRDGRDVRAHADYVDPAMAGPFLEYAASLGPLDVMVEAKMKDLAALRLRAELPHIFQPGRGARAPE
ncbi:MAG: UV DNA damage repair endonuclease UvsE [Firmicutes bacterium]|nr:UV DNA damage repair endonuclease UvsE [Bacillota bacterium]